MEFVIKNLRRSLAVSAGALLFAIRAFSSPALAAPPDTKPWSFQYRLAANAPSNCPDEETIHIVLGARLDKPHSFRQDAARSISVDVTPRSGHVEALIVVRDENGSITTNQKLTTPAWRCDLMAERIVFVLREVIEPLELPPIETKPKSAPTSEPQAPEAPQGPVDVPVPATKATARLERSSKIPKLAFSVGAGAAWWPAPETALSTAIGIEAQWQRISLGIEGYYDHAWAVPNLRDWRAQRTGAALAGCLSHPWLDRFYLRGCIIGAWMQVSFDVPQRKSSDQHAVMLDIGTRFGLGAKLLPAVGVEIRADGAFVIRPADAYLQRDQVWRAAPFTGALRLAFVGAFDVF